MEKLHSAIKRKEKKNSTFATFPTTLSDNFQKNQLLLKKKFSVGPAMNLQYSRAFVMPNIHEVFPEPSACTSPEHAFESVKVEVP